MAPTLHTKHLHLLPYDETRKALFHAVTEQSGGAQSWLTRNHARVHWQGEWVRIGYDPVHTRVKLTIDLPDGDGWLTATGSGGEYDRPAPWQAAFDEALSTLLDTLAERIVSHKREDESHRLLTVLGLD